MNNDLYICDPHKNTECKKTECSYLGKGYCYQTTNKDFSKLYITNQDKFPGFDSVNGEIHYFVNITEEKIKELEKLKAEISELLGSSVWQYDVRKIIDKHIAELKGGDSPSLK